LKNDGVDKMDVVEEPLVAKESEEVVEEPVVAEKLVEELVVAEKTKKRKKNDAEGKRKVPRRGKAAT